MARTRRLRTARIDLRYVEVRGASAGNIMAAIISAHTPRKPQSPKPMVPGPVDMSVRPENVKYHASAAHPIKASSAAWWLTVRPLLSDT
jgi:hypothetical protein